MTVDIPNLAFDKRVMVEEMESVAHSFPISAYLWSFIFLELLVAVPCKQDACLQGKNNSVRSES